MNVLLIQPPIEDFYTTPIRLYPLGLLYVAATLRRLGCEVQLLDCLSPPRKRQTALPPSMRYLKPHFEKNPLLFKHYYRFGLADEMILERIHAAAPDWVGISANFTAYFETTARLARMIKKAYDVPIMIGGNHASAFTKEIGEREPQFDAVLSGAAETALPKFWGERFGGQFQAIDWKTLRPAHDLAAASDYQIGRKPYVSLIASRGCPFACEFCSVHAMFGRKTDYRPVEDVIEEMCLNVQQKGIRIFNFEDDNLSFDRRWFKTFLQRIIDEPLLQGVELTAMNGICYPTLSGELLELMRRAGFRQLNLSFVTHDAELRRVMRRPAHGDLELLVKAAQKLNFFITVYVIIGLPEQSFAEVKQTIDYLLDLDVLVGPSVFYIPPASAMYDGLEISEELRANWELYRSSAFAVETKRLSRAQLIELFNYARAGNLKRKTR